MKKSTHEVVGIGTLAVLNSITKKKGKSMTKDKIIEQLMKLSGYRNVLLTSHLRKFYVRKTKPYLLQLLKKRVIRCPTKE